MVGIQFVATILAVAGSDPVSHSAEQVWPFANSCAFRYKSAAERSSSSSTGRRDGRATSTVPGPGRITTRTWNSVSRSIPSRPSSSSGSAWFSRVTVASVPSRP